MPHGPKHTSMSRQTDEILMKRYGITQADKDRMEDEQGGNCYICGFPPDRRGLFVDHDHKTKEVRGLLCGSCNSGLGFFKDSMVNLMRAVRYLLKRDKK